MIGEMERGTEGRESEKDTEREYGYLPLFPCANFGITVSILRQQAVAFCIKAFILMSAVNSLKVTERQGAKGTVVISSLPWH